ncbi:MAG: hypothetical protein JWQ90_801 [Hydrocarboniphaga sp.]|uniref:hypothetical protein n=1 Tax=Hydrocarboniphaga sp. TaxID=2033016 RepID=UPI00263712B1|nr:hypothetical protein [Hydrocarboniphaga sp.]MDB5968351.1 hypothetical protein [Hydrocarboniphaga sp.]
MNTRLQLFCAWMGPVFLVLYGLAFMALGKYIPPQPPSWSPVDVAMFYAEHTNRIRIAQLLGIIFSTLLFPWFAVISVQMARIEGRYPMLSLMQFGGATLLIVFFQICSMLWIIAAWRQDLDPAIVRMLHESAWLIFVMVFPAFTMQLICLAIAGFMDKSPNPVWPRWACYFNIWVGFAGMGGGLACFFKSGPFAWNGLIGFYIPVAMFSIWLFINASLMIKGIKQQAELPST